MTESIGGVVPLDRMFAGITADVTLDGLPERMPSLSERLIRGLEAHLADEAHDVAACEALANRVGDPIVRFLLTLIVQDEQHHHAVLRSMVARLQEEVDFTPAPADSIIPRAEPRQPI